MNYRQWLDGGCGCNVNINCCGDINPCDCDEILLEISNLHTDDAVLQEEIDDLSGEVETKLDASAYTPVDLSDYYTKEQSDERFLTEHQPLKTINGESLVGEGNIVISGGTDLSNYYNKTDVDSLISGLTAQIAALQQRINNCCQSITPVSPTDLRYTGTTTGGTEISLSCCTDPDCEELVSHSITQTTIQTGNLGTINVGECITIIGTDAFTGETNLTEVILPDTIQYIRDVMLNGCTSMQTLILLGDTPPAFVGTEGALCGLFLGYQSEEVIPSGFKIKVPSNSVNTYKAATIWSRYSDYIESI